MNIDATVVLDRSVDHLPDSIGVAHVAEQRQRFHALAAQRRGSGLDVLGAAAGDHQCGAHSTEGARHGEAEPRAAAGNEGDLAGEQICSEDGQCGTSGGVSPQYSRTFGLAQ